MFRVAVTALAALAVVLPPAAPASQFVDHVRSPVPVALKVDSAGRAMVYYRKGSAARHTLIAGAVNARQPGRSVRQVRFRIDYSGGWRTTGHTLWKTFANACSTYNGPALPAVVAACKAPNGSYWAVQEWMVDQPNYGLPPWTAPRHFYSLRVSHWSGPVAQVELHADWIYSGRFHEVFGRATYDGHAVYGFAHDARGAPTDSYGRLLYLDTLNSSYGVGWRRENAFLSHAPTGVFCNGFYPHAGRGTGVGSRYRLRLIGPGVTPDVESTIDGLHDYRPGNSADVAYEDRENHILDRLAAGGTSCHRH